MKNDNLSQNSHEIYKDLRYLLDKSVTVKSITQKLTPCTEKYDAVLLKHEMRNKNFDYTIILNSEGIVYGYVQRELLGTGNCGQYIQKFGPSDLVAESMPLFDLIEILRDKDRVFVLDRNKVSGIATRADLQKSPTRLLLFGLVNILEMYMLRMIREFYPGESWTNQIRDIRLEKTKSEFEKLKNRNEEIDLASCLQLCDKRDICICNPKVLAKLGIKTKKQGLEFFEEIEKLRNNLAHAQDIIAKSTWEKMIESAIIIDKMLQNFESGVEQ